jgi:UDP-N-acetyl-D-galactosamine dehydrogenase
MSDHLHRSVAVVGLGYVGLPVAVAFAERFPGTIGFDIDVERVSELSRGIDRTREVDDARLRKSNLTLTADPDSLAATDFFIVTVPTPIDEQRRPDLGALRSASQTIGSTMKPGAVVVYESTVYPGVTETICGPILEQASGLRSGIDFTLAYSPERINPGDAEHRFEAIPKVVSAQDGETLELVAEMYGSVIDAAIHRAPTIAVAEAAKVIENTQRDLNIALVNELAVIFDRLGIDTQAVLDAAATKWNFSRYSPGLVGGHCIGVDPYYLTARAEEVGVHPQVILAGRRINDGMGRFVTEAAVKHLVKRGVNTADCRVLVAGMSFKENVPDVRNTAVVSILESLREYGLDATVWDPVCDADAAAHEYGIQLADPGDPSQYDAVILAVPHDDIVASVASWVHSQHIPVLIDVKGSIDPNSLPADVSYWRL